MRLAELTTNPDVLDVVVVLEILDQSGDFGGSFGIRCGNGIFRFINKTAGGRGEVFSSQGFVDGVEAVGRADDFSRVIASGADIVGPGLESGFQGGIRVGIFEKKDTPAAEHPGDGVGAAKISPMFGEEVTDFRGRAVFVIGLGFDHEGDSAGPIAFIGDFLNRSAALKLPGSFLNRTVDVVDGHGFGACGSDGGAESRVEVGITAGQPGGDGNFLGELGEQGPAFDVGGALGAFDFGPMTVPGHRLRMEMGRVGCRVWVIGDRR